MVLAVMVMVGKSVSSVSSSVSSVSSSSPSCGFHRPNSTLLGVGSANTLMPSKLLRLSQCDWSGVYIVVLLGL